MNHVSGNALLNMPSPFAFAFCVLVCSNSLSQIGRSVAEVGDRALVLRVPVEQAMAFRRGPVRRRGVMTRQTNETIDAGQMHKIK